MAEERPAPSGEHWLHQFLMEYEEHIKKHGRPVYRYIDEPPPDEDGPRVKKK